MTNEAQRVARLARRLALPEREADEGFVARVELAREAKALAREANAARRRQIVVEAAGGATLFLAAQQMLDFGGDAADLLAPLASGLGGLVALAGAAALVLLGLAATAGERRRAA